MGERGPPGPAVEGWQLTAEQHLISTNEGSIGIHTSTPVARLDVEGGARVGRAPAVPATLVAGMSDTDIEARVSATDGYPGAGTIVIDAEAMIYTSTSAGRFRGLVRGAYGTAAGTHSGGSTIDSYLFAASAGATRPRAVITSSGLMGLGTGGPQHQLDLRPPFSDQPREGIRIERGAVPAQYSIINHAGGQLNLVSAFEGGQGGDIAFFSSSGDWNTKQQTMVIESDGDVGVGIDNPDRRLCVGGTDSSGWAATISLRNLNPGGVGAFIAVSDDHWAAGPGKMLFGVGTSGNSNDVKLAIADGNVGVGTSNPADRLHVAGHLRVDGELRSDSVRRMLGASSALAMCRMTEPNNTIDTVRIAAGMTGAQVCGASGRGCREVYAVYFYGNDGEGAEGTLLACDFQASSANPDLVGVYACCNR